MNHPKTKLIQERLNVSIQKCRLHLQRLQYAHGQVESLFPLTVDSYNSLSESSIGNIDQMIFRFTKLQDEIGNNTFRFLLEFFQEDIAGKPFRDILNILERLQVIDSDDTWLTLREIRNDLTHEYPLMVNETIEKLNYLYNQIPILEHILIVIEQKAQQ